MLISDICSNLHCACNKILNGSRQIQLDIGFNESEIAQQELRDIGLQVEI